MKVERRYKPHLCASRDVTRSAIGVLNVVKSHKGIDGAAIVATDGRRMIIVPVELEEGDDVGQIRPDALLVADRESINQETKYSGGKMRKVKAKQVTLAVRGEFLEAESTARYPRFSKDGKALRSHLGTYPNTEAIVPDGSPKKCKTSFSPTYLLEMVRAMGGDGCKCTIEFNDDVSEITVRVGTEKAFGILMPLRQDW